ncbi:MAG: sporulation integral membrane protein YtvI [Lachnospiraceae bacterium]|nr:sporulation integral membrane protein YtvI [Lachnospiraceae bacterium]
MKKSVKYAKIFVNIVLFLLLIVGIVVVLPKVLKFFLPFVIGGIIALLTNPLVKFMEKHLKIVRKHSSMMIIIAALALVITIIYFAGVNIARQVMNVMEDIPQIVSGFQEDWEDVQKNVSVVYDKIPQNIQNSLGETYDGIVASLGEVVSNLGAPTVTAVGNIAHNIPSALIGVIMTILSAYFFIADKDRLELLLSKYTPVSVKKYAGLILDDFKHIVGGYFSAQFKIMAIVMAILFVGFLILRAKYAILLAILIAMLDMLPFFGTGTALVPWAIFKLLSGDYKVTIGLLVLYGVTQLVRQLIQPKIVGDTIGLKPLTTLFFMYIGYKFMGVLGMIVAIPVGMILINLYKLGVFDNIIRCGKEIVQDINEFRKW